MNELSIRSKSESESPFLGSNLPINESEETAHIPVPECDPYTFEIIKQKLKDNAFDNWKQYESITSIFLVLGLVFALFEYEFNYTYPRENYQIPDETRILTTLTTILAIIFSCLKRYYRSQWLYYSAKEIYSKSHHSTFYDFPHFWSIPFVIELVIILIQPIPGFDMTFRFRSHTYEYSFFLSEILYSAMFLRIFLLLKYYMNSSLYESFDAKILCLHKYGFPANSRFSIKCLTKKNPLEFVFILLTLTIALLGYWLRIFERPYWSGIEFDNGETSDEDLGYYGTCIWLIIITMCTVGFGDFSPQTVGGRVICEIAALWGGVVTTIMIVVMNNYLTFNQEQSKAFFTLSLSKAAANVIQKFMVYVRVKNNPHSSYKEVKNAYRHLDRMLALFKKEVIASNMLGYNLITPEMKIITKLRKKITYMAVQVKLLVSLFKEKVNREGHSIIQRVPQTSPRKHLNKSASQFFP